MEDNNALNDMVEVMMTVEAKKKKMSNKKWIIIGFIVVLIVVAGFFIIPRLLGSQEKKAEIITTTALEKIVNRSELSTFQAVHNGIAEVMDPENQDQVDYYVSYKAIINLGFDFNAVKYVFGEEEVKRITITIPNIELTDINVDFKSMECMFRNKKAETNTVLPEVYKACIADAKKESENNEEIFKLTEQNARNVMKALISPFVEPLGYELDIVFGGVS